MQELTKRSFTKVKVIFAVVYAYMAIAVLTVAFFQIVRSVEFFRRAQINRARVRFIPAYRSVIYDRTLQRQLAYNVKSVSLVAIPGLLPTGTNRDIVIERLANLLDVPVSNLNATIEEQAIDRFTPVIVAVGIDNRTMVRFTEHKENFPGIYMENIPRRFYPLGRKAAHVLGYTGFISRAEYQELRDDPEYYAGSIIGKMGVEKQYDKKIRGKRGIMNRIVDARGNLIREEIAEEPEHAQPIVLTIDSRLQEMAYTLLAGRNGSVVASKPYTGEILALVSSASFDPNIFSDRYIRDEFLAIKGDENKPFLNRAIQGIYPPGSVFKIVSAVAILASGIDINRRIRCQGWMRVANRIFNCWDVHGAENFFSAFAYSCNIYFYTTGLEIGREKILAYARDFGVNERTGVDIPGESRGLIPEEAWFRRRHNRPWGPGDTANISIGQGDLLVTPIGLNMLTAAVANRGTVYRPFVLKSIIDETTQETIWENTPQVLRKVVLPAASFDHLQRAMHEVTTYGTARWIRYATPYPIAGKTGTGEAGRDRKTHALFTAFAPYGSSNPEDYIVVTVVVEHGGGGAGVAAPIAVRLIDYYYREIHPLNPNQFKR